MNTKEMRGLVLEMLRDGRGGAVTSRNKVQENLRTLRPRISDAKEKINDLEARIYALEEYSISAAVEFFCTEMLQALRTELEPLATELADMQDQAEEMEGELEAMQEEVDAFDMEIAAIEADDKKEA